MKVAMRAKFRVSSVTPYRDDKGNVAHETLIAHAVARSDGYPDDGSDENNTYAKWSPSGALELTVANPALFGKHYIGDEYYLDFTLAPKK